MWVTGCDFVALCPYLELERKFCESDLQIKLYMKKHMTDKNALQLSIPNSNSKISK